MTEEKNNFGVHSIIRTFTEFNNIVYYSLLSNVMTAIVSTFSNSQFESQAAPLKSCLYAFMSFFIVVESVRLVLFTFFLHALSRNAKNR